MARPVSRTEITLNRKDGAETKVYMTPRQEKLFTFLFERLDTPVDVEEVRQHMDISLQNLRVTKMQVQLAIEGYYVIMSKWGKSYTMHQL